jgi:hypothetical protein
MGWEVSVVEETESMPLSDREQKILAEIERHFYEEDPALAHAVRNITRKARLGLRLPVLGVIAGIVIIAFTFTRNTFIALSGFALLVASATVLVHSIRARTYEVDSEDDSNSQSAKRGRRRFGRA